MGVDATGRDDVGDVDATGDDATGDELVGAAVDGPDALVVTDETPDVAVVVVAASVEPEVHALRAAAHPAARNSPDRRVDLMAWTPLFLFDAQAAVRGIGAGAAAGNTLPG